jgi:CheY-like chemotaxis protein
MAALALERLGGFLVTLAQDGEEALELAAKDPPDLVLLDVSMPGLDGPATLKVLRARPGTRSVPVVFFTATSSEVETDRLRALGAVAVVSKPFEVADLARRIQRIVSPRTLD